MEPDMISKEDLAIVANNFAWECLIISWIAIAGMLVFFVSLHFFEKRQNIKKG